MDICFVILAICHNFVPVISTPGCFPHDASGVCLTKMFLYGTNIFIPVRCLGIVVFMFCS